MTDTLIIKKAIDEIQKKDFGTTEQLLNIHEVVYIDHKPKVLRVDTEKGDGSSIVYFAIKDEKFYLAIYLNPLSEVIGVGTESYNSVYFRGTSEKLNLEQLSRLTELTPTSGWSKGEKRKFGNSSYKFSVIHFEPNPEPDEFEDKLEKLLDFLEQDKAGILRLVNQANGYIQIASIFHNGNTMLGGHHLTKRTIKRLGNLNLEVDFDLYAEGSFFKD